MVSLKEKLAKRKVAAQKSQAEELVRRRRSVPLKKDIPASLEREMKEMRKEMATLRSESATALRPMEVAEEEEEEGESELYC